MADLNFDTARVLAFADRQGFCHWLEKHHDIGASVWVKIHKLRSGRPTISPEQAIEVALCWGWIDGLRKSFDENSFLQRYSPRRATSNWSDINARAVRRLIASGDMRSAGFAAVRRGIQRGKWPGSVPIVLPD